MMKAISNRLRRLEGRFVPRRTDELSKAELIRESRRRRCEAEGRPFVETPRFNTTGMTYGEIIRQSHMRQRSR
jgi:hypothetical protein